MIKSANLSSQITLAAPKFKTYTTLTQTYPKCATLKDELTMKFDVCVIGHVTQDLIRIPGRPDRLQVGGSAFYAAIALRHLGASVAVVTKVAPADEEVLLSELRDCGIRVVNGYTETTTTFENTYTDLSIREQTVRHIARPFIPDDLEDLSADVIHLGPLTQGEITPAVIRTARKNSRLLSLDAQGMLRQIHAAQVHLCAWPEAQDALAQTDILKVDDQEAQKITSEADPRLCAHALSRLGPREVLLTLSDRGSLLQTPSKLSPIPALPPVCAVDATGCGDTYVAAYVFKRWSGANPRESAWFAASAASLKLSHYGPFRGTTARVNAGLLSRDSQIEHAQVVTA